MLRIPLIAILICGVLSMSYAQDSAKKRTAVKPTPVYKTYKYHSYRSRADSLARAAQRADTTPPAQPALPISEIIFDSFHFSFAYRAFTHPAA